MYSNRALFRREIYANIAKPISRKKSHSVAFIKSNGGVFEFALGIINGKTRGEWMSLRRRRHTMLLFLGASIHLRARIRAREQWHVPRHSVHYQCCGIFCRTLSWSSLALARLPTSVYNIVTGIKVALQ